MGIKRIKVMPYNSAWPQLFEEEATLLKQHLGEHCLAVYHIGSTSVPGLCAKEDLDILCVVDRLISSLCLQEVGYIFKGELNIPLRYFFSKNSSFSKVNLHVCEKDHGFIALNLCFRDYLRAHEAVRDAYGALKITLANDPTSFERTAAGFPLYTLSKNDFIKKTLEAAGFEGLSIDFCLHTHEWEEYHRIREEQIFEPLQIAYNREHPTMTDPHHFHFVLYKGIHIVSVAQVEFLDEKQAVLRSLATDASYQNQGFGAHLMGILERWVAFHGRTVMKMHARNSAESFYRARDYVPMIFEDPCFDRIQTEYIDLGKFL